MWMKPPLPKTTPPNQIRNNTNAISQLPNGYPFIIRLRCIRAQFLLRGLFQRPAWQADRAHTCMGCIAANHKCRACARHDDRN